MYYIDNTVSGMAADTEDRERLDDVDFSILKAFWDSENPLWKKRVYRYVEQHIDELPLQETVSEQTVGRRIDDLLNEGYLESVITDPDAVDRELIISYRLTDPGRSTMDAKRMEYIRDIVRSDIFRDFRRQDAPINPIISVFVDEFDLTARERDFLRNRFDATQIAALLALYYVEVEAREFFMDTEAEIIRDVAHGDISMKEALRRIDDAG